METVSFDVINTLWDGKVVIRKLNAFKDGRGLLCEVFRKDSDSFKDIIMTYISETKPFIQRGPHEHVTQDDEFVSWHSKMVFQFFNPQTSEMEYFITDPADIVSIRVERGIYHSYRNLDHKKDSYTLNGLNVLFKGENKAGTIDEIRHEKRTENNKVLFIFGAGGRLGKALTKVSYKNMKDHSYDVIPSFDKILNYDDFCSFCKSIDYALKGKDITFINCASLTNTKDSSPLNDEWRWSNVKLPILFAEMCARNKWNYVQLSTNYVYQKVKSKFLSYYLSTYTQSKKEMESVLFGIANQDKVATTSILRVANLYNVEDPSDENIFTRFNKVIKETGVVSVDPNESVAPTEVNKLSLEILCMFLNGSFNTTKIKQFNIIPDVVYKMDDFVKTHFNVTPLSIESKIDGGMHEFLNDLKSNIQKL